jgi:pimeloyl-ACP methyl ester carboxylesterase
LRLGGPGLSGIQDFLDAPEALAEAIGTQYNLVTFDPRGVNRSGIDLDCFQGYDGAKYDFYAEVSGSPVDSSSETALRRTYLLNQGWGERCTAVQDPQQPKGYANTVATANDMLHYIGLRAKSLDQPPEQAKLWYYGASYGTILGQTFATLWPERVDRMVLDGVVDADDYFAGGWLTVLADMDASLRQFFADCLTAGSELCPFAGTSSTVQELETRYHALVEGLNRDPILVDQFLTATPVTVNGQNLKRTTLNSLYHPGLYPAFALNLYELETHRNGSLLADAVGYLLLRVPPPPVLEGERLFFAAESTAQIPCNDQVGRFNLSTFDSFKDLVQTQYNTSFVGGELWASSFTTTCVKYGIRPPQSQIFDGESDHDPYWMKATDSGWRSDWLRQHATDLVH